jgi:hypothetical protein
VPTDAEGADDQQHEHHGYGNRYRHYEEDAEAEVVFE